MGVDYDSFLCGLRSHHLVGFRGVGGPVSADSVVYAHRADCAWCGVVTYKGMDALFDLVIDRINSLVGGLPADLAALVQYMGVFQAVQIITAAVSVRLASSLINGAITRWRARPFVLKA